MSDEDDPFDRLTSLFLGEPLPGDVSEAAHDPVKFEPPRESQITPLLAGNLPVMAHPWLTHVASRLCDGPAALLRVGADGVQCALICAKGPAESEDQDFAGWLLRAAAIVRHWFVAPATGQGVEELVALNVEEVVIASGGDEAASVAAYQLIRRIVECAKKRHHVPPLTPMAMVGCSVEVANEAIATITTAAQAFLQQPVPLAGTYPQLERTQVAQQAFFPCGFSIGEIFEAIRVAEATVSGNRPRQQAPVQPTQVHPQPQPEIPKPSPAAIPRPSPSVAPSAPPPVAPLTLQVRPGSFAAVITGLWSIGLRYPNDAMIEFATDHAGQLHVIAPVEQAASVRQAASWARRNAALIRQGFPGLADPLPIVERIVFADATQAIDWHRCGVRLDLMVRTQDKFVHVSLNDERTLKP